MISAQIKEIIDKIPISLLAFFYILYLGVDYYGFEHDADSAWSQKRNEIQTNKALNEKLEEKIKKNDEFIKSLELKKAGIRRLAQELEEMKNVLPESLDVPAFMKMTLTEAERVGVSISSLKPSGNQEFEYYGENSFSFKFRGLFVQLITFMERISNTNEIIKIDNFEIRPKFSNSGKYVELEGEIQIKAYRYLGSKADSIGKNSVRPATPSSNNNSDNSSGSDKNPGEKS